MRFLSLVKIDPSFQGQDPPQALMDAMGELIDQQIKDGVLLDTGGLLPTSAGAEVKVKDGQVTVVDGPFAEAREVVGGWAFLQCRDLAEAIEHTRRFVQLHIDHFPGFDVTCEVRPCADGPDLGAASA